jgi:hypothetical protein
MAIFVAVFFVVGMDTHDDRRCVKMLHNPKYCF